MNKRLQRARAKHEKWLRKHGIDLKVKKLRELRGVAFPDLCTKSSTPPTSRYPVEHSGPELPQKKEVFTTNLTVGQSHKQGYMVWLSGVDLPEHAGGKKT